MCDFLEKEKLHLSKQKKVLISEFIQIWKKLGEEYESPLEKILFGLYEKNKNEKIKMPPFT
jgi:hypothetical protein